MKLTAYLFFGFIFFTSCSSYKKIDLSVHAINSEKTYKITTTSSKKIIVKKCELTPTTLNCSKNTIPLNEIVEIKERKFSYLKTAAIPIIYIGAGIGMLAIILGN